MDTLWILYRHTLALRGRATAVHDLPAALPHFQAATRANPVHHAEPPVQPSPNRLFWRKTTKTQTPKPSPRETHRAFLSPLTLFSLALSSSLSLLSRLGVTRTRDSLTLTFAHARAQTDEGNWRALAKVHDLLGDVAEAAKAAERADAARANSAAYSA